MMERRFDTPGDVVIALQIGAGDIAIRTSDTTQTSVHITGYGAENEPRVTCDPVPGGGYRVTIEHRGKRTWGFSFGRGLDIEVSVPNGARLDGTSGSAELEIHGTLGSLAFRTGSGDIEFDDVTGDIDLACASGDVEGRNVGGHLAFKGASGDIDIAAVGGGTTIRSASGDIRIGDLTGSSTITIGSGDIELGRVAGGVVNVRAIAGDVHVGVRSGMGVWLDVSSTGGDVHSNLDAAQRSDESTEPELELTVNTVSGDIDVVRAAAVSG